MNTLFGFSASHFALFLWLDLLVNQSHEFIATTSFKCIFSLELSLLIRPENIPRLFDLVRVKDEAVKTCFYFALRNTLVAKDIDQATRIGYGKTRYRVVTLKGEIIELSGERHKIWGVKSEACLGVICLILVSCIPCAVLS